MPPDENAEEKLKTLLEYWINHEREHEKENSAWVSRARDMGFHDIAEELERAVHVSRDAAHHVHHARELLKKRKEHGSAHDHGHSGDSVVPHHHIQLHQIGIIKTPFPPGTDWNTIHKSETECRIILDERYEEGLSKLELFSYIIVLFHLDRVSGDIPVKVKPPWCGGAEVGVFASRSPHRPNPVGLTIARILGIEGCRIRTSKIDAYDGTPLIDIKPYFEGSDSKPGAGNGWKDELSE